LLLRAVKLPFGGFHYKSFNINKMGLNRVDHKLVN
jgi:hypothetical protein